MITQRERPINIRDLIVDEPPNEGYVFRPENELSQKDLRDILNYLDELKKSQISDMDYAQLLYQLNVLFPDIRGSLNLDEEAFETMSRIISSHTLIMKDLFIAEKFCLSAFPERFDKSSHLDVQLAQYLEMAQTDIDNSFSARDAYKTENLASFKIIYPDAYKEFKNPDRTRASIVAAMSSFDDGLVIARNLRILFPQVPIDDVISDPTITQARRSFDWSKSTHQWGKAVNEAFTLFILSAKDVQTGQGKLEIVLPKKIAVENTELPETRRF